MSHVTSDSTLKNYITIFPTNQTEMLVQHMPTGESLLMNLSCPTGNGLCVDLKKSWRHIRRKRFIVVERYQVSGDNTLKNRLLQVFGENLCQEESRLMMGAETTVLKCEGSRVVSAGKN